MAVAALENREAVMHELEDYILSLPGTLALSTFVDIHKEEPLYAGLWNTIQELPSTWDGLSEIRKIQKAEDCIKLIAQIQNAKAIYYTSKIYKIGLMLTLLVSLTATLSTYTLIYNDSPRNQKAASYLIITAVMTGIITYLSSQLNKCLNTRNCAIALCDNQIPELRQISNNLKRILSAYKHLPASRALTTETSLIYEALPQPIARLPFYNPLLPADEATISIRSAEEKSPKS